MVLMNYTWVLAKPISQSNCTLNSFAMVVLFDVSYTISHYPIIHWTVIQFHTDVIHAMYIDVLLGILIFAWSITSVSNAHKCK